MKNIAPYLSFQGNCREAMEFYKQALGGDLILQSIGESPMAGQMPVEMHKNIIHSQLKVDGFSVMASDMFSAKEASTGNRITICLVCSSPEEIKNSFNSLAEGAKIETPLIEEFFGTFAALTDKFGIRWMFQFDSN